MNTFQFSQTRNGLPVLGHNFGSSGPKVLILGGVHGDEYEGIVAAKALLGKFMQSFNYKLQLTIVPEFNIDGSSIAQRKNAAGVDLNRNLPSNDWEANVAQEKYHPGPSPNSEPENQGLVKWLEEHKPQFVLTLHSWKPVLNTNGDCQAEAEVIAKHTDYKIVESIGYPTPGCLGTYCGLERGMPTLTYEIERGLASDKIVAIHVPAILDALKETEKRKV